VYLLGLAFLSGLGLLVGGVQSSGSVESELPVYLARTWGFMLTFGAGASLAGMFWQGDRRTGLLVKRVGLLALSIAAYVYAAVVVTAAGMRGAFVAGVIIGFGVACSVQFARINRRIHQIIQAS
jgi:hypothetical protein